MPSKAYGVFQKNIKQVDKMLEAYEDKKEPTRGRKHLDHYTRAALLFLCSAWEVYIEQIALEGAEVIVNRVKFPEDLPDPIKKKLSEKVKSARHELEPIRIASNWKAYYIESVKEQTEKINTPKHGIIQELFNKYLGIKGDDLLRKVPKLRAVNEIVTSRGEIAHNVFADEYLKADLVKEYYDIILELVKGIDVFLWEYLYDIVETKKKRPWQNTYQ